MEDGYKVSDMYLAAALVSYGAELLDVDKRDRKRQKFIFGGKIDQVYVLSGNGGFAVLKSPEFSEIEAKFVAKRLCFLPNYPNSIRDMKSVIYT